MLAGVVADRATCVVGDVEQQTREVYRRVAAILAEEGLTLRHVVEVTGYLADAADFKGYDRVWRELFADDPPARTTVAAQLLVPGALVEVSVTAQR
jgi:enamine deaminase RidA (YjgF/YER057c/UK114 family)